MCKRLILPLSIILVSGLVLTRSVGAADPSLVCCWAFDGNLTNSGSTGSANDGAGVGSPTYAAGQSGQALSLNGTNQYVNCGTLNLSTNGTGGITLCAWINRPAIAGDRKIIGNRNGNSGFKMGVYNGANSGNTPRLEMEVWDAGGQTLTRATNGTALTATNTWYHVVCVFDDTANEVREYVNGVLDATTTSVTRSLVASTGTLRLCAEMPTANYYFSGLLDDVRVYGRVLSVAEIQGAMKGEDTTSASSNPRPADKATDVSRDVVLGWTAGKFAAQHDVYFGTAAADVDAADRTSAKGVLVSQAQNGTTYGSASLRDYGQTYYWRVDEVNAAPSTTIFKGTVWSFTAEPYAYPLKNIKATASSAQLNMGPENTVNGFGLDTADLHGIDPLTMWMSSGAQPNWIQYEFDKAYKLSEMWVWNSNQIIESFVGFGAKDVKIEYSTDGTTWIVLPAAPQFARAPASAGYAHNTTVNFGGAFAKYVKLTINATWSGLPQGGLAEVRFFSVPVQAREPQPATGATGVDLDAMLSWRPGREAASHQVFFGANKDAVAGGTATAVTVTDHRFSPASLQFGTTYYWKVDEVNTAASTKSWTGEVWSFTTKEFQAVDDFESYNDDDNRIYDAWLDGLANSNGSLVGYMAAPFAERTIVHGGKQSMPVAYDNTKSPFYSEAESEFASVQNWTVNGATDLSLWFKGNPAAFVDKGGNMLTVSGAGTDIWDVADNFRLVYKKLSGNGSITARVDSIVNTNVWAKAGVTIRETLSAGSRHAIVVVTPGNSCAFQWRPNADGVSTNVGWTGTAVTAPYWVRMTRTGNVFKAETAPDGKTWTQMGTDTTVAMGTDVYLGLCVTSHDTALVTTAEYSNVSTTGAVTGAWQMAAIGVNPEPANSPDKLYVAVEDSTGKQTIVAHPNPAAVSLAAWTQWKIPLSSFTGVNLAKVKKLYLGVGDRKNPVVNGAGIIYIDDIGFGRAAQ